MELVAGLSVEGMSSPVPEVSNFVCACKWPELQAKAFGPLLHPNPIDQAIASGKRFRVRPFFGRYSIADAFALAQSIVFNDSGDNISAPVPDWTNHRLQLAQANLVVRLAEEYDGKIPAIFLGTNGTIYAEPFMRQVGDAITRRNLTLAGITATADAPTYDYCLDMFSAFSKTRLAWAFNPWQFVKPDGTAGNDVAFTISMMAELRRRFPDSIVQNNSIRTPTLGKPGSPYGLMYQAMERPLAFQTATAARVGNYGETIEWAIAQGAHLVELSPGFQTYVTKAKLIEYDKALRANA